MKSDERARIKDWESQARIAGYSIEAMAARRNTTSRLLRRCFHEIFQRPLHIWLHDLRMQDAVRMLNPGSSVKEVAQVLGYENRLRFSEAFRRYYGRTPAEHLTLADGDPPTPDEVDAFMEYVSRRREIQPSMVRQVNGSLSSGVHWESMGRLSRYSAARLAQKCQVSPRHLRRHFREVFGLGVKEWLHELRLRDAGRLLHPHQETRQTWRILGYREPSSFCRHFKAYYQKTPTEYLETRIKRIVEIESFSVQYLEIFT